METGIKKLPRHCSTLPGRSCHSTIKDLSKHLFSRPVSTVIDIDLENFFGTLNHTKLIEILEVKIKDQRLIRYITIAKPL